LWPEYSFSPGSARGVSTAASSSERLLRRRTTKPSSTLSRFSELERRAQMIWAGSRLRDIRPGHPRRTPICRWPRGRQGEPAAHEAQLSRTGNECLEDELQQRGALACPAHCPASSSKPSSLLPQASSARLTMPGSCRADTGNDERASQRGAASISAGIGVCRRGDRHRRQPRRRRLPADHHADGSPRVPGRGPGPALPRAAGNRVAADSHVDVRPGRAAGDRGWLAHHVVGQASSLWDSAVQDPQLAGCATVARGPLSFESARRTLRVRRDRLARGDVPDLVVQTILRIRPAESAGLAVARTTMIIGRRQRRLQIGKPEPGVPGIRSHRPQTARSTLPPRSADILNDMDSRASDKIPGARVRVTRPSSAQSSSDGRPREWLALADGAVQEARTEGPALALVGRPLPYQPGRAERRSGVPTEVITSDHVPNSCTCSWAYSQRKLTLKHYNAACPVHRASLGR
jgi:hypothetical protein